MNSSLPLTFLFFSLLIPHFGWSLVPCHVDPDVPGYHWTDGSMYLSLATSSHLGLWHASAEPSSCSEGQLCDAANLISPFWVKVFASAHGRVRYKSAQSLPAGDDNVAGTLNKGMERESWKANALGYLSCILSLVWVESFHFYPF